MEQVLNEILCSDKKYRKIFNTNAHGKVAFFQFKLADEEHVIVSPLS